MSQGSNWWRNAVIYQIYPRSFYDSNGDGIGDLPGISQKLDYLVSLNIDALWISPFFPSPMKDFGYDISDYYGVDPIFGTLEDFQTLLKNAHSYGLKVLIDQVWNHTSDQHPWFQESRSSRDNPKADWYVWVDPQPDGSPPNNWQATFGGSAWTWEEQREQYYLHNFLTSQPDLNWYNPEVIEAILKVARFWLDLGVDGFRLDVINFLTHDRLLRDNPVREQKRPAGADPHDPYFDYINRYNICQPETLTLLEKIRAVMDEYPGTTTLGEVSSAEDTILTSSEYVRGNHRLHMAYNSSLMSQEPLTCSRVREIISQVQAQVGDGVICWTGGTHDFPRLKSRWREFLIDDRFTQEAFDHLFVALLISLPGSCCLYQGEELGLTQAEIPYEKLQDPFGIAGYPQIKGRDGSRTPFPWQKNAPNAGFTEARDPWLPIPEEHLDRAIDQQETNPHSLLNKYRRLFRWRKQQPALLNGRMQLLETPDPILGLKRESSEQTLVILFNFSPKPLHFNLSAFGTYINANPTDFPVREYETTIELPPYGVFFGHSRLGFADS